MADKIDLAERLHVPRRRAADPPRGGWRCWRASPAGPGPKAPDAKAESGPGEDRLGPGHAQRQPLVRPHGRGHAPARTAPPARRRSTRSTPNSRSLEEGTAAPENCSRLLQARGEPDKDVGKAIGDILIGLLMPAVRKVQYGRRPGGAGPPQPPAGRSPWPPTTATQGAIPKTLDGLAPKYLAASPRRRLLRQGARSTSRPRRATCSTASAPTARTRAAAGTTTTRPATTRASACRCRNCRRSRRAARRKPAGFLGERRGVSPPVVDRRAHAAPLASQGRPTGARRVARAPGSDWGGPYPLRPAPAHPGRVALARRRAVGDHAAGRLRTAAGAQSLSLWNISSQKVRDGI